MTILWGSALQFLELMTSLPREFVGDMLFVTPEGRAFLSSTGRGDGRHLYSLTESDFEFYLQTHGLLWAAFPEGVHAGQVALA